MGRMTRAAKADVAEMVKQENQQLKQERDEARFEANLSRDALEFYTSTEPEVGEILAENAQLAALVGVLRGALATFRHADGCFCESAFAGPDTHVRHTDECVAACNALALTPPDTLAELEARVRRKEQERCCQAICHYCLEHVQGKQVSAAYSNDRDEWAHEIYISGIDEPLIRYCRAQAIREAADD